MLQKSLLMLAMVMGSMLMTSCACLDDRPTEIVNVIEGRGDSTPLTGEAD